MGVHEHTVGKWRRRFAMLTFLIPDIPDASAWGILPKRQRVAQKDRVKRGNAAIAATEPGSSSTSSR